MTPGVRRQLGLRIDQVHGLLAVSLQSLEVHRPLVTEGTVNALFI
jgi:hypothetical protein